jgi:N-carbamoylputrescine amidase
VRVTVCQLHEDRDRFERDWNELALHIQSKGSELVLLAEMPFSAWFALDRQYDQQTWQAAVEAHDFWCQRLPDLSPASVFATRPVNKHHDRLNEGFLWNETVGYRPVHTKCRLPDEDGVWEASWYHPGPEDYAPIEVSGVRIGYMICSEIWDFERARTYGKLGTQVLLSPRATGTGTVDKWLVAGRAAAVVSGAFSLSSNRVTGNADAADFGGQGWIVGPDGDVLALTSSAEPFATVDIDPTEADRARKTYPRYIF